MLSSASCCCRCWLACRCSTYHKRAGWQPRDFILAILSSALGVVLTRGSKRNCRQGEHNGCNKDLQNFLLTNWPPLCGSLFSRIYGCGHCGIRSTTSFLCPAGRSRPGPKPRIGLGHFPARKKTTPAPGNTEAVAVGDCAFWLHCSEHIKNQNWPKAVYLRVATLFDNRVIRPASEHEARHSQRSDARRRAMANNPGFVDFLAVKAPIFSACKRNSSVSAVRSDLTAFLRCVAFVGKTVLHAGPPRAPTLLFSLCGCA